MRPVLFELGGVSVPAYGTCLVVMFLVGFTLLSRRGRPLGLDDGHLLNLLTIAAGVILAWTVLGAALRRIGLAPHPALNALPVLAVGAFAFLAYLRRNALPAEAIFDAIAPIAALALAVQFGIGTLLAGTAFGKPTSLPWGLVFPPGSPAWRVFGSQPLHPTQLYLALPFLAIAAAAWRTPAHRRKGISALMTFAAIAAVYLLVSPLRGNTRSLLAGEMPRMSELVALFTLCYTLIMARRLQRLRPSQSPSR